MSKRTEQIQMDVTMVMEYYESVAYSRQATDLFPDASESYQKIWGMRLKSGFIKAWEKMDSDTRRTYIENALKHHEV